MSRKTHLAAPTQVDVAALKIADTRCPDEAADTALRASIEELGVLTPILIDKNHNVIAGRRRATIARELGHKTIPAIVAAPQIARNPLLAITHENTMRTHLSPRDLLHNLTQLMTTVPATQLNTETQLLEWAGVQLATSRPTLSKLLYVGDHATPDEWADLQRHQKIDATYKIIRKRLEQPTNGEEKTAAREEDDDNDWITIEIRRGTLAAIINAAPYGANLLSKEELTNLKKALKRATTKGTK